MNRRIWQQGEAQGQKEWHRQRFCPYRQVPRLKTITTLITSWMAFWTKAGVFIGIVPTIIAAIAHFPAHYAAIVCLATKLTFTTAACFCHSHQQQRHHKSVNKATKH